MSGKDTDHFYCAKSFPGATISDMEDYVKPLTRKSPQKMILHVGTNDLRTSSPKAIADSIINLVTQVREDSPETAVGVSALLVRSDQALNTNIKQVNGLLKDLCKRHRVPYLTNANIDYNHLNSKGLT